MLIPPEQSRVLLDTARNAIRAALVGNTLAKIETADSVLLQPAGCFVSLHRKETHALRGCVGRLDAREALIEAVRDTAAGVLEDPRFVEDPVTLAELPKLEIEISVISQLYPIDKPEDFDLLNDGIYVSFAGRTGCFLPQVARETGWTREHLLDRLCTEKLGLPALAWRHPQAALSRFTTSILGPEPFGL